MKTKTLIMVFFTLIFFSIDAVSQNAKVKADSRLYQCYDSSYVHQMMTNNPPLVAYYNFYLDNSYYVVKLKQPKSVTGIDIHTVKINDDLAKGKTQYFCEKIFDASTFNVLKYSFGTNDFNFTTYIWKEAGIALVFLPRDKIAAAYKEYLKKNNISSL
jgi:hypothetical protein